MRILIVASGVVLFTAVGGAVAFAATGLAPQSSGNPLPPFKQAIVDQQMAAHDALIKSGAHVAKMSYEQGLKEAQAADKAASSTRSGAVASTQAPTSGVVITNDGPYPRPSFQTTSAWIGSVATAPATTWVSVYAGGAEANPDATGNVPTGGVRVFTQASPTSDDGTYVGEFDASAGTGPLTITAVHGSTLTLHAANGSSLVFNLLTHAFSS